MTSPVLAPDARRTRSRDPRMIRRRLVVLIVVAAVVVIALIVALIVAGGGKPKPASATSASPRSSASASSSPSAAASASATPSASAAAGAFNKSQYSLTDPTSIWVVVDKTRQLSPANYAPADLVAIPSLGSTYGGVPHLRKEAAAQLVAMLAQFHTDTGLSMQSQSDYRSFASQTKVYNGWVASKGQAQADLQSARPGFSEHQTGMAIDLVGVPATCGLDACFATTPQGSWLAANAYKWGFILRYPQGKTAITGYEFEPWHFRYVGVALATEMHTTGISTLEEFFGLPASPTYAAG